MQKNKKGFTLIELLVVIAIIGILSTLAVISLGSARTKARDSKRISDMRSLQSALEVYYTDQQAYPGNSIANSCAAPGTTIEGCCLDNNTATSATPGWKVAGSCTAGFTLITITTDSTTGYEYPYTTSGSPANSYYVNFRLESPTSPMKEYNCLSPAGMTGDVTGTTGDATC